MTNRGVYQFHPPARRAVRWLDDAPIFEIIQSFNELVEIAAYPKFWNRDIVFRQTTTHGVFMGRAY